MSVVEADRQSVRQEGQEPSTASRRLRVWPAVVIVVLGLAAIWVPAFVAPATMLQFMAMFFGPMAMAGLVAVWWLAASRATWQEKLVGLGVFAAVAAITTVAVHPSIAGPALMVLAAPIVITLTVAALAIGNRFSTKTRRIATVVAILIGWGFWTVVRSDGLTGAGMPELASRWSPTAEEQFLAERGKTTTKATELAATPVVAAPGDWTGFRGPNRDGRAPGVTIATDWKASPPREVWRHAIGPGWGSFAIVGGRLYTQEQRGEEEIVSCYDAKTGAEVWAHSDKTRFWESMAGAGPRATPTFVEGRIYALGANGLLNCLDASDGKKVWSRDAAAESKAALPMWGFSASPLVTKGVVIVHTGGPDGKGVLAYRADSGEPAWTAAAGAFSYSSPHLATLGGVEQVLMSTDDGLVSLEPETGKTLWDYKWSMPQMARIVQPHPLDESRVLLGTGYGEGTRLLTVIRSGEEWKIDEGWTSKHLKPYFNDFVSHEGHAYGFDGEILACVDLETGKRTWRARGYGHGQVLLLPDQDLLVALTETGELALVEAKPGKHAEIARVPALAGKTWNHPVLVGDRLYVRNAEEVACFELKGAAGEALAAVAELGRRRTKLRSPASSRSRASSVLPGARSMNRRVAWPARPGGGAARSRSETFER